MSLLPHRPLTTYPLPCSARHLIHSDCHPKQEHYPRECRPHPEEHPHRRRGDRSCSRLGIVTSTAAVRHACSRSRDFIIIAATCGVARSPLARGFFHRRLVDHFYPDGGEQLHAPPAPIFSSTQRRVATASHRPRRALPTARRQHVPLPQLVFPPTSCYRRRPLF